MKTHNKKWRLIGYPHGPGAAEQPLNEAAFDEFVDETITKTYAKARIDQLKLLLIALLTALAPLTYYRGRGRPKQLSKWLKDLWDPFTCGTISGLILLGPIINTGTYLGFSYTPTTPILLVVLNGEHFPSNGGCNGHATTLGDTKRRSG